MTPKGPRKKWALYVYSISMFMNLNRGKASERNSMSICYRFVKRLIHHIKDVRVNFSSLFLRHCSSCNHWTVLILGPQPADYRHKSGPHYRLKSSTFASPNFQLIIMDASCDTIRCLKVKKWRYLQLSLCFVIFSLYIVAVDLLWLCDIDHSTSAQEKFIRFDKHTSLFSHGSQLTWKSD